MMNPDDVRIERDPTGPEMHAALTARSVTEEMAARESGKDARKMKTRARYGIRPPREHRVHQPFSLEIGSAHGPTEVEINRFGKGKVKTTLGADLARRRFEAERAQREADAREEVAAYVSLRRLDKTMGQLYPEDREVRVRSHTRREAAQRIAKKTRNLREDVAFGRVSDAERERRIQEIVVDARGSAEEERLRRRAVR
jgi:hypothetical protein